MAGTAHMALCQAAAAALGTGLGAGVDGGVHAGPRKRPMADQFTRQVHVYLDFSRFERGDTSHAPNDNKTRLRIECCARTDTVADKAGHLVADALAADCYALIAGNPMALAVSGIDLMDVEPVGLAWDGDEADSAIGITQLLFDLKHRTASNTIAAP